MNIKKIINNKIIFSIIFLIILYAISLNLPLNSDDFAYSFSRMTKTDLTSIIDVIKSVSYEYMTWNGRILGYFFTQLFLISDNQLLFRIVYPWINLLIVFLIKRLISDDDEDNYLLYIVSSILLFAHTLVLNQTMFWIIGWSIYVLPLVFIIPVLIYCKNIFFNKENKYKFIFIFGFLGSLFVEHYSLIILGFTVCSVVYELYKNKKVSKSTILLLIFVILGNLVIFFAPGLSIRASGDMTSSMALSDRLHFGWSRFIYTFFYMNQRIFLMMIILLIYYHLRRISLNKTKSIINIILLIPMLILSTILVFKASLLPPLIYECLTGEWSYYTCELKDLIKYSSIVIYYIIILLINVIDISLYKKNIWYFILFAAAISSSLVFILSNMACERTQFISYIIFMILFLELINVNDIKGLLLNIMIISFILLFIYDGIKYINGYINEYKIYIENDNRYKQCAIDKCDEIYVIEHDYRFVFKSDLNFDDQKGWVFNAIKRYYNLPKDTLIYPQGVTK